MKPIKPIKMMMFEYRLIPIGDENLFKSYLCFYVESENNNHEEIARNRANTLGYMMFNNFGVKYDIELVSSCEVN